MSKNELKVDISVYYNENLKDINEAGALASRIASSVTPTLTAQEESFFVAGFQECYKIFECVNQWVLIKERKPDIRKDIVVKSDITLKKQIVNFPTVEVMESYIRLDSYTHWRYFL